LLKGLAKGKDCYFQPNGPPVQETVRDGAGDIGDADFGAFDGWPDDAFQKVFWLAAKDAE
jgi:hypothetical protein